ncbi:Receptor protein serine/threonine kinase [Gryllus bimaculatus]|nr:Receptor protein serine/threonine kinase [Gryllus bimaculatus]
MHSPTQQVSCSQAVPVLSLTPSSQPSSPPALHSHEQVSAGRSLPVSPVPRQASRQRGRVSSGGSRGGRERAAAAAGAPWPSHEPHGVGRPWRGGSAARAPPTRKRAADRLQLTCLVGQGRYGSVWKGSYQDRDVAVKIFPAHHRQYYLNERDIYCLPFMDCPALLSYYGCEERPSVEGGLQYLLVLSYAPNGSLQDYLRSHTLDCATFCRMAQGVARGLAHLHTDVRKGDKVKPCVSHRDLNTRNILVTNDLGTVLCDLGFAMKLQGSKYFCNGETQHAETKSINDVGTLRYMAPEVLEGAVNLRDCESSLKQIDVYALGLVLWELATRCSDLYQPNAEVPPYRLPFEAEVGHHPTFEQMQGLVTRHKARPLFPETWWDWAGVRLLRETVEDCWDQDAEARLTALCVQERLSELPGLWDRQRATMYVSGVSPTVNPTFPSSGSGGTVTQSNATGGQSQRCSATNNNINNYSVAGGAAVLGSGCQTQECSRPLLMEPSEDNSISARPVSQMSSSYGKEARESTVSEGTVETMVTMSPSEPQVLDTFKNSNMANGNIGHGGYAYSFNSGNNLQPSVPQSCCYPSSPPCGGPLQAFQGRNPCMERNLMLAAGSEEELSCRGNTLVDRSLKHAYESQALVSHDFLAAAVAATAGPNSAAPVPTGPLSTTGPRPATPIPYVQNAVYDLYSTQPKQPNIPGNGNSSAAATTATSVDSSGRTSRWPSWGGLKRLLNSKKQLLFGRDRISSSGSYDPPVSSPPGYYPKDPDFNDCDDVKSNLLIHQNGLVALAEPMKKSPIIMDTQVCLLPPSKTGAGKTSDGVVTSVTSPSSHHTTSSPPPPPPLESSDDSRAKQQRRPSTLPLVPVKTSNEAPMDRGSIEEQFQKVFGSNSRSESSRRLKDPSLRVKTPGDVPPSVRRLRSRGAKGSTTARFSLYDDRMMSGGVSGLDEELIGSAPDISHKSSAGSATAISVTKQSPPGILKSSSRELRANLYWMMSSFNITDELDCQTT